MPAVPAAAVRCAYCSALRLSLLLLLPPPPIEPAAPLACQLQVFLYPIGGIVAILPLSILLGLNPTSLMLKWYFPAR